MLTLLPLLVWQLGCGTSHDVDDLRALGAAIGATVGVAPPYLRPVRGGSIIAVFFENAPVTEGPRAEQQSFARRAAEYLRDHYDGYAKLSHIGVFFIARETSDGLAIRRLRGVIPFSTADLGGIENP